MQEYVSYNELKHWGIKGMKWRHKKTRAELAQDAQREYWQKVQDPNTWDIGGRIANKAEEVHDNYMSAFKDPHYQRNKAAAKMLNDLSKVKIKDIGSIGTYIKTAWTGAKSVREGSKKDKAAIKNTKNAINTIGNIARKITGQR